jgi:regulatory protein
MPERRITGLVVQKKNPNRVNVYLDGEFAFGVARVVAAWLRNGQVLSEEKIQNLKQQDANEVALQKALMLLSYRPRSETEIRRKLVEAGFDEEIILAVIERLKQNGLAGDETFAKLWVENQTTFRPRGRRALAMELRQKGVEEEIIQQAIDETVDEETLAYQAAIRYSRRLAGLEWREFRDRLSAYLMRRGFSYGTIKPLVSKVWSELRSTDTDLNGNEENYE